MNLRRWLDASGRASVWICAIALVGLGLSKLIGWELGSRMWWAWIALGIVGAILEGARRSVRHRLSDAEAGGVLDQQLGLKSQIRSAIEFERDHDSDNVTKGFVELTKRNAESIASGVDIARAIQPIQTTHWQVGGAIIAIMVVMGIWIPTRVGAPGPVPTQIPSRAIASIDSINDQQPAEDSLAESESPKVRDAIEELEALKEELAKGVSDPSQADAQAAAKLEQLADALDEEAQETREQAQEIADRISQAQNAAENQQTNESRWDPKFDEFADAIRDQDFEQAQEQLDALRKQVESMSEAERQKLADQLEQLADAVEPDEPSTTQPEKNAENEPEQDSSSESTPESSPEKEQSKPNPSKDLSESMRDEAEQLRKQGQPDNQQPKDQAPQESKDDTNQNDQPANQQEQQQDGAKESEQPAKESAQRPTSESEPQNQQQANEQGEEQSSEQQPGDQPSDPSEQQDQPGSSPKDSQSKQDGRKQAQEQTGGDQQRKTLDESLKDMQQRKEQSKRNQQRADEIRKQAEQLIGQDPSDDPQENPQDQRSKGTQSEQDQPNQPGSAGDEPRSDEDAQDADPNAINDFVPMDATDPEKTNNADEPIGKWYAPDGEASDLDQRQAASERLRQASKQAQRAVEGQEVPRKYRDLVREVFKRVEKHADDMGSTGQVAPQGKDATSKSESKSQPKDSSE